MRLFTGIRYALRTWRRAKGFAAIAILTMTLGIGATTALFSVVDAVLLRSFGYADSARLVQLSGTNKQGQQTGVSAPDFLAIQERVHGLQQVGISRVQTFVMAGPREPVSVFGQLVSRECFPVLGAMPLLGRVFTASDYASGAPPVAVLSFKLWKRDFAGDPKIVGRRVLMDGVDYSVIGVMYEEFQFPHPAFLLWTPWRLSPGEIANRRAHAYRLIARLRGQTTLQTAAAELQSLSAALEREFPDTNSGWRALAEPVNEQLIGKFRPALLTMLGAVGFVLLIACLNVSNLLMARGLARTREMAIRAALGASRLRLAGQLFSESLAIALAGGVLGLLFARLCLQLLLSLLTARTSLGFPRIDQAALDGRVLLAAVAIMAVTGVVFGLFPAIELSRPDIETALKEGGRSNTGGMRRRRFLSGLIVAESALSVILLIGAGLMLRSFAQIVEVRPGFHPEHVLAAEIPSGWRPDGTNRASDTSEKIRYFRDIVQRLSSLPGVTSAGLITGLPMGTVATNTLIRREGRTAGADEEIRIGYSAVSPGYFETMGIPMLKGRPFTDADTTDRPVVAIVNEAMARRYWPNEDPTGKRFTFNPRGEGPWVPIVGVAGNVRNFGLTTEPESQLYTSYLQSLLSPQNAAVVVRSMLDPAALAGTIRTTIHQSNPSQPISEVKTMTQMVADSVAQPRLYTVLLAIFAGLALALAGAGIFSVLTWTVNQKTHEIGIRVALGATPRDVIGSIMGRAIVETVAGAIAGLAGAAALTGILKSQLYHVTATDPLAFLAAPVLLLLAAAIAAYLPARRATRVDPAQALTIQ